MASRHAPESQRGVTVSMAMDYLAPARATDLIGDGRVLRYVVTSFNRPVATSKMKPRSDSCLVTKGLASIRLID
jgi:acyl-coenzyme A thioesterase PaaI-like protein